ncbi:MAG: putative exported protein [Pseudomonadota bacterium]
MMRLFLFALLLANVVMLLVLQSFRPSGVEPERLALQLHAERVSVQKAGKEAAPPPISPSSPSSPSSSDPPPAAASVPKAPPAAMAPRRAPGKCIEVGDFNAQTAAKFESALPQLSLPVLPVKRVVQASPSQIVMLSPQASEAAANRRVAQLREQGFKDVSVMREASARRWGISLGVFSKPELADAQLAALKQAGVSDARIEEHPLNSSRLAYQLVGLEADAGDGLRKLVSGFAGVTLRDCP